MIQFKENARTDGRTEGWTDRLYFIGPFRLPPGVQQCTGEKVLVNPNENSDFFCSSRTSIFIFSQPAFNCSKLTIETLEQGVKYVQS